MMRVLPVFRRLDVPPGEAYWLPSGSRAKNLTSGVDLSVPPGYYVHSSDPRSDAEIRRVFAARPKAALKLKVGA